MDIGVIGLGQMGAGIARSLLRAGHTVTVYNRTASKAAPFAALGARVAKEPAEACRGDAVITMLSDDAAVQSLVCAPHGLLDVIAPMRTVHISASTISPALVRDLAERHGERNQRFISVPVLGRPEVAAAGKLSALAAGDPDVIDSVRPAIDAFAQRVFVVGPAPAAANVVKLACNTLLASVIEALGETLSLVMHNGVDKQVFVDVLMNTLLASPVFRPYGEHVRDGNYEPGFRLPLALKDIELALATAESSGVPLPIANVIRDHMVDEIDQGHAEEDWSVLTRVA